MFGDAAGRLGVRLIGLDRPGIGSSDAKSDFYILDWPDALIGRYRRHSRPWSVLALNGSVVNDPTRTIGSTPGAA